jgi:hypothetical protein
LPRTREAMEQRLAEVEAERDGLKVAIRQKDIADQRQKLRWVIGISLFGTLGCAALAIFLPLARRWAVYGALACLAVAGLAWALAQLVPYLIWIGLAVLAAGVALAIWNWRTDNRALRSVVAAVEPLKPTIADYRTHFRDFIDSGSDKRIDQVRKWLGLKPQP